MYSAKLQSSRDKLKPKPLLVCGTLADEREGDNPEAAHFVTTARFVTKHKFVKSDAQPARFVTKHKFVKSDALPARFVTPARFVITWLQNVSKGPLVARFVTPSPATSVCPFPRCVCVCVCVCACTRACVYVCVCTCERVCVRACVPTRMYMCARGRGRACVRACVVAASSLFFIEFIELALSVTYNLTISIVFPCAGFCLFG